MAIKVSTGLANELADRASLRTNLKGGRLLIFSGTKPVDADTATSGTLLATATNASGAFVAETRATFLVTVSGVAGTLDTLKIGGISIISGAVTLSAVNAGADAIAANINAYMSIPDCTATTTGSSGVVTITLPKGSGADFNGVAITSTQTTATITINGGSSTTVGGAGATAGVAAVNGLQLTFPASAGAVGISGTWSGLGVAAATATHFRYCCDGDDAGTGASTAYRRIDGSITATGGAGDATIDNINISINQTVTVTAFSFGINRG